MRQPFIAGNWKMYKTTAEAIAFADVFKELYEKTGAQTQTAICAPFTQLDALMECFDGTNIGVGAQNVHYEDEGAFTGEVSAPMLTELGVDYCVVGHSERRQYFAETDETVNLKVKKLFASGITPIMCVGESLEQRDDGRAADVVESQIKADLDGLTKEQVAELVVAYEPIWAIGTGRTATPEQAQEMCHAIRETISGICGETTAQQVIIQYGGSVKPANVADIMKQDDIDGALVGGASLQPEDFIQILNY